MTTLVAILIVAQHFLFDWILQPRWVAVNKSHSNVALGIHGWIVGFGFFGVAAIACPLITAAIVSVIYTLAHIIQDRMVWGLLFKPKTDNPYQEKGFWNTVAIDQFIHLTVAILLLSL